MKRYRVVNSEADFGIYPGETEEEAIQAMLKDCYADPELNKVEDFHAYECDTILSYTFVLPDEIQALDLREALADKSVPVTACARVHYANTTGDACYWDETGRGAVTSNGNAVWYDCDSFDDLLRRANDCEDPSSR